MLNTPRWQRSLQLATTRHRCRARLGGTMETSCRRPVCTLQLPQPRVSTTCSSCIATACISPTAVRSSLLLLSTRQQRLQTS